MLGTSIITKKGINTTLNELCFISGKGDENIVLDRAFGKGIAWNTVSLAFLGVSGIVLNLLVGRYYGPEVLGIFNQVYAVYILVSQLAVGGVHISCLRHVAQCDSDHECGEIVYAALGTTIGFGVFAGIGLAISHGLGGWLLSSNGVSTGLLYVAPGLPLFALNKVFLSILNGRRRMQAFSLFQSLRYLLLLGFLLVFIALGLSPYALPGIITLGELFLMPGLAWYSLRGIPFYMPFNYFGNWQKRHFQFGIKVLWGGMVAELNTRADVLLLGYFSTDYSVGLYSVAAMLAEGFYQLFIVFRTNLNPLLAKLLAEQKLEELRMLRRNTFRMIYLLAFFAGALLIFLYPLVCRWLLGSEYLNAWMVLIVIVIGTACSAGYIAFGNILSQGGYPGWETILTFTVIAVNIAVGIIVIPRFDIIGAAFTTAISFIVNSILLKWLSFRLIGLKI